MHLKRVADDERRTMTPSPIGGLSTGRATFISESGLYKLVMRSDKPEARQFQDWVTREVLPCRPGDRGGGRCQIWPTFGRKTVADIP